MTKFKRLARNKYFEFSLDEILEFAEFFKMVIEDNNRLIFIYKKAKGDNTGFLQENITNYYVNQRGYTKVIFLKQV
jgi:hypothetical protein